MRVLLFSGGMDSTALAGWLRPDALFFVDYGQAPASGELRAAQHLASVLRLPFQFGTANCRDFGAGEMAGAEALSSDAPEFWPYRNQLLITIAAMAYAAVDSLKLYIGTVRGDAVHPDGQPKFLFAMNELLRSQADVTVEAPALNLTAMELQRRAKLPLEILSWAFSCHRSSHACGLCRGCTKHFETLQYLEADPANLRS